MSISVSDELQLFAQEIQNFLSPNFLRNLARDVGLVQRTSKYQAQDLIALCVWISQNVASSVYPGAGGCSHTAGLKIQLEYDLLSGQFLHIHTGPGKQHDRTYGSLCVPTVKANDLCIRDLGYFHLKDFQHIKNKKAYYISRIKSNTRIYQKNPTPDYFQDGRIKKGTEYI